MPKIETQFRWNIGDEKKKTDAYLASLVGKETEVPSIGAKETKKLKSGDEVILVLERVYVRDNKEWWGYGEMLRLTYPFKLPPKISQRM